MYWTYFKSIGHRPVTRGKGCEASPANFFALLEKSVAHNFKIWAPLRKLFATPGVLSWLRARAKPSDGLTFLTNNRDVTINLEMVINELFKKKRRLNFIF